MLLAQKETVKRVKIFNKRFVVNAIIWIIWSFKFCLICFRVLFVFHLDFILTNYTTQCCQDSIQYFSSLYKCTGGNITDFPRIVRFIRRTFKPLPRIHRIIRPKNPALGIQLGKLFNFMNICLYNVLNERNSIQSTWML